MDIEKRHKRSSYRSMNQTLKDISWIDNLPEDIKQDVLRRRNSGFKPDNLKFRQRLKRDKIKKNWYK